MPSGPSHLPCPAPRDGQLPRRTFVTGLPLVALAAGCATLVRQPGRSPSGPAAPPSASPTIAPVYYTLSLEGRDLGAEIFLNDVLIDTLDAAERATASTTINAWVTGGTNQLRVRSMPGHVGAHPPVVQARVGKRGADDLGTPELLTTLQIAPPRPDAVADQSTTFKVDPAPPTELWPRAESLRLDGDARAAAGNLTRDLERAFAARDPGRVMALLGRKTADVARASFRDQELARTTLRVLLDTLFSVPGFTKDFLTPEALVFDLCANQRLLRVARPTGPALQIRLSQGGRYRLPLLFAKIDGAWTIAR
ncbi:MAG TPA: hypothetical protein VGF45_03745 [Polyangia bacterium]